VLNVKFSATQMMKTGQRFLIFEARLAAWALPAGSRARHSLASMARGPGAGGAGFSGGRWRFPIRRPARRRGRSGGQVQHCTRRKRAGNYRWSSSAKAARKASLIFHSDPDGGHIRQAFDRPARRSAVAREIPSMPSRTLRNMWRRERVLRCLGPRGPRPSAPVLGASRWRNRRLTSTPFVQRRDRSKARRALQRNLRARIKLRAPAGIARKLLGRPRRRWRRADPFHADHGSAA